MGLAQAAESNINDRVASILGEADRCALSHIPRVRARNGFEAWLRGSGWHRSPEAAEKLLASWDRKQERESSILVSQAAINDAITLAFKSSLFGRPWKTAILHLNCQAPKISVERETDAASEAPAIPAFRMTLACDTDYQAPFKASCKVSPTQLCTGIQVRVVPVIQAEGKRSILSVRWKLEDLAVTPPTLQGLLENKVISLEQDVDRFAEHSSELARSGANIKQIMGELQKVVDSRFIEVTGLLNRIQENVVSLRELLPLIAEMSKDAGQFSKLLHDLLPPGMQNDALIAALLQNLEMQLPVLQKQIPALTLQVEQLEKQLTKILASIQASRSGIAQEQLNLIESQLVQSTDLVLSIASIRDEIKAALVLLPQIGEQQDQKVSAALTKLKAQLLQTVQTRLPQEFKIATLPAIEKNLELSPLGVIEFKGRLLQPVIETWEEQVSVRIPLRHEALRVVLP